MKRHYSLLVSILVMIAVVLSLAACNVPGSDVNAHQHTFSDAWQRDAANHWHAATCKEADCATAVAAKGAHVDADADKFCDVCAYDLGHKHSFGSEWVKDAQNHWHAANCGHNAQADKAAHVLDAAGKCTVCGYTAGAINVADAVELATALKDLVKSGDVVFTSASYAGANFSSFTASYEYGNNLVNIKDTATEEEYWYFVGANDYFMPVKEYVDWSENLVAAFDSNATVEAMGGYGFASVFGYDGDTYYGVEALISELYALASANTLGATTEYVATVDGVVNYTFNFTVLVYNQEYDYDAGEYVDTDEIKDLYEVAVAFALADDYSVSNASVSSTKYAVLGYNDDYELEETGNVTFIYDEEDETKIIGYDITKFNTEAYYEYLVMQTSGDRTLEPKYTPEKDLIASFELELEDGTPVTDTINMTVGTKLSLYLANVAPETYNVSLDSFEVDDPTWSVSGSYVDSLECINISCYKAGEHTITISTTNVTKTYTVVAVAPDTTELGFEETVGWESVSIAEKKLYLAEGGSATFDFEVVANAYANASCTIAIKDAPEAASIVDNGDNQYAFTATALGTYEIVVTSSVADDVTATLVVTVVEAPDVADVLKGAYSAMTGNMMGQTKIIAEFVPASEGAKNGTLNINFVTSGWSGEVRGSAVYTYAYADGAITTTYVSGDEVGYIFALNADFDLTVAVDYYSEPAVMEAYTAPTPTDVVAGEYRYNELDEEDDIVYILKLILNTDGTGTFVYMADYNPSSYKYETNETDTFKFTVAVDADGAYTITVSDVSENGKIAAGTYTVGSVLNNWDEPVDAVLGVSATVGGETNEFDMIWY